MSHMRQQYKEGLCVVAEYKMMGEGSLGREHLKAKYLRDQGLMQTVMPLSGYCLPNVMVIT